MPRTASPARTQTARLQNYLAYSEDLTQWGKMNCTTPSATTIQDSSDGSPVYHGASKNATSLPPGGPVTLSFSAKAGTKSWVCLDIYNDIVASFDLGNGAVGTINTVTLGPGATSTIVPDTSLGTGWYRCTLTWPNPKYLQYAPTVYFFTAFANNSASYQGDGTGTIFVTKVQLVKANWAGDYAYTGASQVGVGLPLRSRVDKRVSLRNMGTSVAIGTNGYITKAGILTNFGTKSYSFSFWGKALYQPDNTAGNQQVFMGTGSGVYYLDFNLRGGNNNFHCASSAGDNVIIIPQIPNSWNHYVITTGQQGDMKNRLYVNGVLVATSTAYANYSDFTTPDFSLGQVVIQGWPALMGLVDEARVWKEKILTDAEISDLYYRNIVPQRASLIVEWLLNEGSGSTATDTSGKGNDGTIVNSAYSNNVPMKMRVVA